MYTLAEMNARLAYLQSISPAGGRKVIDELRAAIEAYLTRTPDFELQVHKTLDKVIADTFFHGLKYENMELLAKWQNYSKGGEPEGYNNVQDLFKSTYIFEEILSVPEYNFRMAFYESSSGNSSSGEADYHNRYVDRWVAQLTAAVESELNGLKSIMQYCANRSYNLEWAILFEELKRKTEYHPVKYYAKQIYVTRGWGWLIETFNLNVYLPSYFDELPNWTEEES